MMRRPPRSTLSSSSAASDVYKRQCLYNAVAAHLPITLGRMFIGFFQATKGVVADYMPSTVLFALLAKRCDAHTRKLCQLLENVDASEECKMGVQDLEENHRVLAHDLLLGLREVHAEMQATSCSRVAGIVVLLNIVNILLFVANDLLVEPNPGVSSASYRLHASFFISMFLVQLLLPIRTVVRCNRTAQQVLAAFCQKVLVCGHLGTCQVQALQTQLMACLVEGFAVQICGITLNHTFFIGVVGAGLTTVARKASGM
eukprot:TRINITY_DN24443_c0_g1_i1.p1 TRINITY_DN24443_c0_g1~~TRINITY_DN24443_c0_g1_i1.p1  ORF type:complete len:258 (+),score=74.36 TRINITY_DN24443_c0_g1_i1:94-867(+)